ncbi:hypothetical protein BC940DRAFT_270838 [Gongronella butleri]|nr:hypothetical protein BC940DRAFT_270838 [Gongronella butleri]
MAIEQFALTLGIATSDWITYGTHHLPTSASWSLPIALQLLPCTVLMLSLLVIPESPRYLVAKRQDERALQILATIRGDGTTNHPHVVMEYHAMRQAITYENGFRNHDSYTRLFSGPPENNLRRLLLGVTVQSAMQWTGTPVVIAFAAQILPGLDIQVGSPQLFSNAISGTVYCISSFFAMVFIDHYSRRFTLFIGALLGFVCLAIMGTIAIIGDFKYVQKAWDLAISGDEIYDDIVPHHDSEFAYRNAVAFLVLGNLFIAIMGYTWGVISWVYPSELYTQRWLFTFVVLKITPTMLTSIHGATYFVYAISCLITAFIVHLFFPETNGKSLEEVDLIFQSNLNYYDENTHHPQSAAETMAEMDKLREKESLLYPLFDAEFASGAKTSIFEYPVLEDLWTYHRRVSPPSPSLQTNVGNIKQ